MVERPIGVAVAVLLAAPILGAAATVAPPVEAPSSIGAAHRSVLEALEREVLLRRLSALEERMGDLGAELWDLRWAAVRLRRRADSARLRRQRDGFFAFDASRLKDDVWRRKLEMSNRRGDADRLARDMQADRRLARKADAALKTALQLGERAADLERTSEDLAASAQAAAGSLIGESAAWNTATALSEARAISVHMAYLKGALEEAASKARGGP